MRFRLTGLAIFLTGIIAFVLIATSACIPDPNSNIRFTSADRNYRFWGLPGVLTAADGAGGGTEEQPVQRTVVEPDVIRRNGPWLYVLNQFRGLTIVNLDQWQIVSNLPTLGFPRDLYIQDGRAYVLVSRANRYNVSGNTVRFTIGSRLYIVDVADPQNASILSSIDLQGDLVDSRLVGNVLYAVGAQVDWYYGWAEPADGVVSNNSKLVKSRTGGTWVTSVNCANPQNIFVADEVDFDGTGTEIHATSEAVFVSAPSWSTNTTQVTYVDISDPAGTMAVRGSVVVPGQVNDRFKMDYWNGVLRIVSYSWSNSRHTYLTTLDCSNPDSLSILAEYEFDRATGETLFATRFDGARGYLVTYFVVDPLFIADLADPTSPALVGELEVPGWSTYIEPLGERLLALGVDDTGGSRRVCVSLFNVADPTNPTLADRVTFGNSWNWSSAYDDVKSLAVFEDTVVVPFSGWEESYGQGFNRLQFVSYTPDDLTLRGYLDVQGTVLRTFKYNALYYCVTSEQLIAIDASNLNAPIAVNSLTLAENVADYQEIAPSVGAEIIAQREINQTLVRLETPTKAKLGEVTLDISDVTDTFVYDSYLVLVAAEYDPDFRYRVIMINCSDPTKPNIETDLVVDVEPYMSWWYYYDGPVVLGGSVDGAPPAVGLRDAKMMIYPWRVTLPGMVYLAGNMLVLRCSASSYSNVLGNEIPPNQGLAVVNLDTKQWIRTIGLGFREVVSVNSKDNFIYITSKTDAGLNFGQPLCAYYVTRVNPATGTSGQTANVPGVFVQYDPSNQILTLRDDQWSSFYDYRSVLRTVSWDGASADVTVIDSKNLPSNVNQVIGRGTRIYMDAYDSAGYKLFAAQQSAGGALTIGTGILITDQWGCLIDGHGSAAYVSIGDGAIARYNCTNGLPQFSLLVEVMGTPLRIRFGTARAYAPIGYFGTAILPL